MASATKRITAAKVQATAGGRVESGTRYGA
jgi:hypothetical protein